jgi:hypothetical protein
MRSVRRNAITEGDRRRVENPYVHRVRPSNRLDEICLNFQFRLDRRGGDRLQMHCDVDVAEPILGEERTMEIGEGQIRPARQDIPCPLAHSVLIMAGQMETFRLHGKKRNR